MNSSGNGPDPELGVFMKISYFKLATFQQCPLKYRFLYVDWLGKQYRKPRPPMSMGESIHRALRDFFRISNPEDRSLEKFHYLLRKNWIREGFGNRDEERIWGKKALKILERFYRSNDCRVQPLFTELNFEVKIEDLIFVGVVDRIDRLDNGIFQVIEYKTGAKSMTSEEADGDIQLTFYNLAIREKYHFEPIKLTIYFLQSNKQIDTFRTDEQLQEGLREIANIVGKIKGTREFEPQRNQFCPWCDFLEICPIRGEIRIPIKETAYPEDIPF